MTVEQTDDTKVTPLCQPAYASLNRNYQVITVSEHEKYLSWLAEVRVPADKTGSKMMPKTENYPEH